jgi:hypothetical protein
MNDIKMLIESSKYSPLNASDSAAMEVMLKNTQIEHDHILAEGTFSGDVATFTPILMPMVRRVYPNLIANEILGVQPMVMSNGYVYALTNQYTGTGNNKTDPNSNGVIVDVTYGSGADTVAEVVPTEGDSITASGGATGTVLYVETVTDTTAKILIGTSGSIAAGETITGFTDQDDDVVTVDVSYTNEAAFGRIFKDYTGPKSTANTEQLGLDMKEMGFSIVRKNVEAVARSLKGQYTVEMYQDLKAQHGLLADEEIMSLMSYEMQAEIDREVVDFVNFNATQLGDTVTFTNAADSTGRWEIEKYRTQAIRMSKEAAIIGINTKRGQGNILLVSPKVATMLEQVGSFKAAEIASGVSAPASGGVAGTFDNRYKVIIDQYATSDYCTVLYKGADRRDAMGFFAPYVPLSFTKVVNYLTGQPAVIAKTRYALTTIPGITNGESDDRAKTYVRTFGINFTNTVLA